MPPSWLDHTPAAITTCSATTFVAADASRTPLDPVAGDQHLGDLAPVRSSPPARRSASASATVSARGSIT